MLEPLKRSAPLTIPVLRLVDRCATPAPRSGCLGTELPDRSLL